MTERRSRTCGVCGRAWTPKNTGAVCCSLYCSMVLSALKHLLSSLRPLRRDQWTRVGLRACRTAWVVSRAQKRVDNKPE